MLQEGSLTLLLYGSREAQTLLSNVLSDVAPLLVRRARAPHPHRLILVADESVRVRMDVFHPLRRPQGTESLDDLARFGELVETHNGSALNELTPDKLLGLLVQWEGYRRLPASHKFTQLGKRAAFDNIQGAPQLELNRATKLQAVPSSPDSAISSMQTFSISIAHDLLNDMLSSYAILSYSY